MDSEVLLIVLDQSLRQLDERSIIKPNSIEDLRSFVKNNFGFNSFDLYYLDIYNRQQNITNDEEYRRSNNVIFIMEKNYIKTSLLEKVNAKLNESKIDEIDEKYCCLICSEKLTENPYYCYQCTKRFCKNCFAKISKKSNPVQCPYCKYELESDKWCTLKNFIEEKNQFLNLIDENLKLKEEISTFNQKENEYLQKIDCLNDQLKQSDLKLKNQLILLMQKSEEIKKLKVELNMYKSSPQKLKKEKNDFLLQQDKDDEIDQFIKEKNSLINPLQNSYAKDKKLKPLNSKMKLNQIYNSNDYFIYDVSQNHFDDIGYVNILGETFVKNNKGSLIINDTITLDNLVSKYELKTGINKIKIILDKNRVSDLSYMFYNCNSLINISPLRNLDVSYVENFSGLFYFCKSLTDISPLKNWDVSNGNNFSWMFYGCESLSDISALQNWNVRNIKNFNSIFFDCKSLTDISSLKNWNVRNGNDFSLMFKGCRALKDTSPLKNWNVINGDNFSWMFRGVRNISDDVVKNFKNLNSNFANSSYY